MTELDILRAFSELNPAERLRAMELIKFHYCLACGDRQPGDHSQRCACESA